jgi:arginyl-tRNA synthetase
MAFEEQIAAVVADFLQKEYTFSIPAESILFQPTRPEFVGDFSLNVFPWTKPTGQNPIALAEALGREVVAKLDIVEGFEVVKGFLNLKIRDEEWIKTLSVEPMVQKNRGKIMIEFSSPNTNKPQHLGHVRNNLLGVSIANILESVGYEVIRTNLINDRGIHICKSMIAWMREGMTQTPETTGEKGDHFVGRYYVKYNSLYTNEVNELKDKGVAEAEAEKQASILLEAQDLLRKWEMGDEETLAIWRKMNGWVYDGFTATYERLGVHFDSIMYESQTYLLGKEIVEEGLAKGAFYHRPDGAVAVDLRDEGLDEKVLLRSDGTSVYMTQDLGTALKRFEDNDIDRCIYVVGSEQEYHFKVLSLVFKKLGRENIYHGIYHLSYGMIDLPTGRMKSREGTVVDADNLMTEMHETAYEAIKDFGRVGVETEDYKQELAEKIGLGALKYFLLKVDPQKRMIFDPTASIDLQGNTGPFIQYTYARIQSLIAKAEITETANSEIDSINEYEKDLLKTLYRLNSVKENAAASYSPAIIANFTYELAQKFNSFYQNVPILQTEQPSVKQFRLQLAKRTAETIESQLNLLGIKAPDRM